MKKLFLNLTLFISTFFFAGIINAYAANPVSVPEESVPADTYIIGTNIFTSDRTYLSTEDIMWAARSIPGNPTRDQMTIYYKDYNENWINGVTGNTITPPSTFDIEEADGSVLKLLGVGNILYNGNDIGISNGISVAQATVYTEVEKTYTVNFITYNLEDGTYPLEVLESVYGSAEAFLVGTAPSSVEVTNGVFSVDITIPANKVEEIYQYSFDIGELQANILMNVGADGKSIELMDLMYEGYLSESPVFMNPHPETIFNEENNSEQIVLDNSHKNLVFSGFNSRFILDGTYPVTFTAKRNGVNVPSADTFFNASSNVNITNGRFVFQFETPLYISQGVYEFTLEVDGTSYTIFVQIEETSKGIWFNEQGISITLLPDGGMGGINPASDGKYYVSNSFESVYSPGFQYKNMEDGTYPVMFTAYKKINNQFVEIDSNQFTPSTSTELEQNHFSVDFTTPKDIEIGEYKFVISIDGEEEEFIFVIRNEVSIVLTETKINNSGTLEPFTGYYTTETDKTYRYYYETNNIPNGYYTATISSWKFGGNGSGALNSNITKQIYVKNGHFYLDYTILEGTEQGLYNMIIDLNDVTDNKPYGSISKEIDIKSSTGPVTGEGHSVIDLTYQSTPLDWSPKGYLAETGKSYDLDLALPGLTNGTYDVYIQTYNIENGNHGIMQLGGNQTSMVVTDGEGRIILSIPQLGVTDFNIRYEIVIDEELIRNIDFTTPYIIMNDNVGMDTPGLGAGSAPLLEEDGILRHTNMSPYEPTTYHMTIDTYGIAEGTYNLTAVLTKDGEEVTDIVFPEQVTLVTDGEGMSLLFAIPNDYEVGEYNLMLTVDGRTLNLPIIVQDQAN